MLQDVLEGGDRGVCNAKQLAAHGNGRKREWGSDAKVLGQRRTKGRVEISGNRAHVGQRTVLICVQWARDGRNGWNKLLSQRSLPVSFSISAETVQRGEADRSLSSNRRRSLEGSNSTVKVSKSKDHPIHVTLADRAALCQLIGTRRTQSNTTRSADRRGADDRSRMANKSST